MLLVWDWFNSELLQIQGFDRRRSRTVFVVDEESVRWRDGSRRRPSRRSLLIDIVDLRPGVPS